MEKARLHSKVGNALVRALAYLGRPKAFLGHTTLYYSKVASLQLVFVGFHCISSFVSHAVTTMSHNARGVKTPEKNSRSFCLRH